MDMFFNPPPPVAGFAYNPFVNGIVPGIPNYGINAGAKIKGAGADTYVGKPKKKKNIGAIITAMILSGLAIAGLAILSKGKGKNTKEIAEKASGSVKKFFVNIGAFFKKGADQVGKGVKDGLVGDSTKTTKSFTKSQIKARAKAINKTRQARIKAEQIANRKKVDPAKVEVPNTGLPKVETPELSPRRVQLSKFRANLKTKIEKLRRETPAQFEHVQLGKNTPAKPQLALPPHIETVEAPVINYKKAVGLEKELTGEQVLIEKIKKDPKFGPVPSSKIETVTNEVKSPLAIEQYSKSKQERMARVDAKVQANQLRNEAKNPVRTEGINLEPPKLGEITQAGKAKPQKQVKTPKKTTTEDLSTSFKNLGARIKIKLNEIKKSFEAGAWDTSPYKHQFDWVPGANFKADRMNFALAERNVATRNQIAYKNNRYYYGQAPSNISQTSQNNNRYFHQQTPSKVTLQNKQR